MSFMQQSTAVERGLKMAQMINRAGRVSEDTSNVSLHIKCSSCPDRDADSSQRAFFDDGDGHRPL